MAQIPTVEAFLQNSDKTTFNAIENTMIEFAKMHVEAALKAKAEAMIEKSYEDSSYSIGELDAFTHDAYPLTNIK